MTEHDLKDALDDWSDVLSGKEGHES